MILSEPEKKWLNNVENKKDMLGQVFTPEDVADLMVSIAMDSNPQTILEPCFGEGAFLESINKKVNNKNVRIIGVEIDPVLYGKVNDKSLNMELYNTDFFDFEEKVDSIVMNPPYIRQELLKKEMPKFLSKEKIWERLPLTENMISPRSNLYIYFFIKAWALLKNHGEIIAIVPNTWMAAEYGRSFKEFLLSNFWIKSIIQFNKDVFPNADVDSCIIHLVKNSECINKDSNLVNINQELSKSEIEIFNTLIQSMDKKLSVKETLNEILQTESNWLTLFNENPFFDLMESMVLLERVAKLKRGLTTNYNEFFINNENQFVNQFPNYFTEIICSPKDVKGYSTKYLAKKQFLFTTQESKENLPFEIRNYVDKYEKEILDNVTPKTLYDKIIAKPDTWFNIKKIDGAPILFSYIVRDRKKFILNESELVARDNFYEISPKNSVNKFILFSILNSRITSLFLEDLGRSHGKGLLKIQKYELEKLLIINPDKIIEKDLFQLEKLGKDLLNSLEEDALSYISEIDRILLPYVSTKLRIQDLVKMLEEKLETRLSKKNGFLKLVKE
ncbi:Eco57I restriction-modification methylase domain-containing protein [Halalkalibacterium ligniniphilum]|uniref:Eco57I restriction-modification methylase domain-containing protein n=1 Tax=Halalkalibacterium ligniniphilum TaxID=1134413 RepID=UPI00034761AE|nr:N-6 DNA methylase [Halalkalibacterium ligniniphilum]